MARWKGEGYLRGPLNGEERSIRKGVEGQGKTDALGFGSVSKEDNDRTTLKRERAGDQLCLRMSMQMLPRSLIFMW